MLKVIVTPECLNVLPFHEVLSWEEFQTLCADVLHNKYDSIDTREYLKKGNEQQGIDIYSIKRNEEEITVAQCKLYDHLGPQDVYNLIDEFLKGNLVEQTREFILCTSADLTRQRDEEQTIKEVRKRFAPHGIEFLVWDKNGLSQKFRNEVKPEMFNIVYRYFGAEVALAFYGDIWKDHLKRLRKIDKKKYAVPQDYIERTVIAYKEKINRKQSDLYEWNRKPYESLAEILEEGTGKKSNKIVLLSTAGYGKTEEINNVAGHFSDESKVLYPIKFTLRNYQGQSIETLLSTYSSDWENIPREMILLLFDGLDEIEEKHFDAFIKSANAFVEQNSEINWIVSSRYNFYKVDFPQLMGFEVMILNPLTHLDIHKYLDEKLGLRKEAFLQKLEDNAFKEFLDNPYYLTRLVRFYNTPTIAFPKNKADLFEKILFEKLDSDSNRYNKAELKTLLLPYARKIAYCMTVSGKSLLTDEEVNTIVKDTDIKKHLKLFAIFNRNESKIGLWSFEHKNLQEYLCASVLKDLPFSRVHKIISFDFDDTKLLPGFLNTCGFLFEIIDKESELFKKLFSWLSENEPELLIRFEKEQLTKETRRVIFRKIFHHYKQVGLSIRVSNNFTDEELAKFVEFDKEDIAFMVEEYKSGLHEVSLYDVLRLLTHVQRPFLYKHQITSFLYTVLTDNRYSQYIPAQAIKNFALLGFTDRCVFDRILSCNIDFRNYEIRQACIYFLSYSDFFEEFQVFLIDSIDIIENEQKRKSIWGDFFNIKDLLLKCKTPNGVKQLLRYCLVEEKSIAYHYGSSKEFKFELKEVEQMLQNAEAVYHMDTSALPIVYRLFCKLDHLAMHIEWAEPFRKYFEGTCGALIVFKKLYKYDRKDVDPMVLADGATCDFLIQEYERGSLNEQKLIYYRNTLHYINRDLFLLFYNQLKALGNERFVIEGFGINHDEIRLQQEQKNQEMLLNKGLFLEEAEAIFSVINKDKITPRDLWVYENKELNRFQHSIVLQAIRETCLHDDDKMISRDEFHTNYKDSSVWGYYTAQRTVDLLNRKGNQAVLVHPDLLTGLQSWTVEKIKTWDFNACVIDIDHSSFNFSHGVEFVKQVMLLIKIDLTDDLLLKMLPSTYETFFGWDSGSNDSNTILDIIVERVQNRALLKETVLSNIRTKKLAIQVLCGHFLICYKLRYSECLDALYTAIITNPLLDGYNRTKLAKIYLGLGGEMTDFSAFLKLPRTMDSTRNLDTWNWFLIEELMFPEKAKVAAILVETLTDSSSDSDKLIAAEHLIEMGYIEGLEFFATSIKEQGHLPSERRWEHLQNYVTSLPSYKAVDVFLSLLEFSCDDSVGITKMGTYSMNHFVYASLINLSIGNAINFHRILEKVSQLISQFPGSSADYSLKVFSKNLAHQYYQSQVREVTLVEAINTYNLIGVG